jgi:uncharacterized repeat protein (TIGR03803 family)
MPDKRVEHVSALVVKFAIMLFAVMALVAASQAQTESVIFNFGGSTAGFDPATPLISDSAGNLYGSVTSGGAASAGTIYKLTPNNGTWNLSVLYEFRGGTDGEYVGAITLDDRGNIYGTTSHGGAHNLGTVFKLYPTANGWKKTVLFNFSVSAGGIPPQAFFSNTLTFDSAGNLYGVTTNGIKHPQGGTVYRLSPTASGPWTHTVLWDFSGGVDGQFLTDRKLLLDSAGNVYGVATAGGTYGGGVVFKLTPAASGPWTKTVLYTFVGTADGAAPNGGLVSDSQGNLYGTTEGGGSAKCYPGCGVVFKLVPTKSGEWTEHTLLIFQNQESPYGGLIRDSAGNLYGTAYAGGSGSGIVFELSPPTTGAWTETILHTFAGSPTDGQGPLTTLLRDKSGNLFGTTFGGGSNYGGTAFEIVP